MQSARLLYYLLILIVFGLNFSCGKNKSNEMATYFSEKESIRQSDEGSYIAHLKPMNAAISGFSIGKAIVDIKGDHVTVKLNMKNTPANTMHAQHIYAVSSCPDEYQDSNSDGYIDPVEASIYLGKILIALDDNLHSQVEEFESFPVADHLGNYQYYQQGSLSRIMSDLTNPIELLKLEEKVLVVSGVSEESYLPGSIQSLKPNTDRKSLMIACDKISRNNASRTEELVPEVSY